jgi:hypothetical protein
MLVVSKFVGKYILRLDVYNKLVFKFFFVFCNKLVEKSLPCSLLLRWQIQKVSLTPNMITYAHFLILLSEFKPNLTNKNIINSIINQVIDCFCFKPRLNNTPMNPNFERSEFWHVALYSIKRHKHLLAVLGENWEMVRIFYA